MSGALAPSLSALKNVPIHDHEIEFQFTSETPQISLEKLYFRGESV
jgi:hypothetical protein